MKIAFKVGDKEVENMSFGLFPCEGNRYVIGIKEFEDEDKNIIENALKDNILLKIEESDLILETAKKYYYFREVNFREILNRSGYSFAIGFAFFDSNGKIVEQKIKFIGIEWK